jgi:hypothetical protein
MAGFQLTKDGQTFDLDISGSASKGGAKIGAWTTSGDENNNIVVKPTSGASVTIEVVWKFNASNQMTISSGGNEVYNLHQPGIRPKYEVTDNVLKVKPDASKAFGFDLNGEWAMNKEHDLTVAFNGVESVIDGFVEDDKSRFVYHFFTKAGDQMLTRLTFAGQWDHEVDDGDPLMHFRGNRVTKVNGQPVTKGFVLELPGKVMFDRTINQLVYDYDKNGFSHRLQFVGQLNISPKFVITYKLDSFKSGGKQLVASTTVEIKATYDTPKFGANLFVTLMKNNGQPGTTLEIGGDFTKDLGGAKLKVAFSYKFSKVLGQPSPAKTLNLSGSLEPKDNGALTWAFSADSVTRIMVISFDAHDFAIGEVMLNAKLNFKTESGHLVGVHMLFGFNF